MKHQSKEVENEKLQRSRSMQGLRYLYGGIKISSGFALSDTKLSDKI